MATAILLIWFNRTSVRIQKYAGLAFVGLLTIEFCANYIYPMYYQFARMPSAAANPYAGAPFVRFLQRHCGDQYRIVGQNGVLVPNWAAAFQISDIRYLDALYVSNYFPWLEAFFPDWPAYSPELSQCFRGLAEFDFTRPVTQRLLQLSSVKYIVATNFFAPPDPVIEAILEQNRGHLTPGHESQVSDQTFSINKEIRRTLGEHPPYERLPYDVVVPRSHPVFRFSYGIETGAWSLPGDGVDFSIELRDKSGSIQRVFSKYIDPKHNTSDRRWMEGEIDLRSYAGQPIQLLFSTGPGPAGNTAADWAGWSDLHFGDRPAAPQSVFEPVYDREVKISEYDHVLPRAAVFYQVDLEPDDAMVLKRLADPAFDPFRAVVVNSHALTKSNEAKLFQFDNRSSPQLTPAVIAHYSSQQVVIEANALGSGLLMLNDTAYPGWKAEVDGRDAPILTTNYYFRGVLLTPGKHRVRFLYRPRAFLIGATITLATALVLAVFGLLRLLARKSKHSSNLP